MRVIKNRELLSALKNANSVFICAHIFPDGDAIGSILAADSLLRSMGKETAMALADPVPRKYAFLPGCERIMTADEANESCRGYDLGLALDAADAERLGSLKEIFLSARVTAQIDHHRTNPGYAMINEIDGNASSTGCMIWWLMNAFGHRTAREEAECLYTAISTDTGNFCFSNTDEDTFLCASELAASGFDLNQTARKVHLLREIPHVKLLGRAIASLHIFADGMCAGMMLRAEDYRQAGAEREHSDGIVNYAMNLNGVRMAYLADTEEEGYIRFSFRAIDPYDVSALAKRLGGGGHRLASGCRTELTEKEALAAVEQYMTEEAKRV